MMTLQSEDKEFKHLILGARPEINPDVLNKIIQFRQFVEKENEIQNLTKMVKPREFFDGHLIDCLQLVETKWLKATACDLGSGVGVPGLLTAILDQKPQWVLSEGILKRAEFLERVKNELNLDQVQVVARRIEDVIKQVKVQTIVSRAVGPVDRILNWIGSSPNWQELILFKSSGWKEEWSSFQKSKFRNSLKCVATHAYEVGSDRKFRVLVRLERSPL